MKKNKRIFALVMAVALFITSLTGISGQFTMEALANTEKTTTVYFYNSDNWETVGAHAWGSADLTGAWGSTTATESEIGDGWYEVTLNTTETFSIIFFDTQNDGNPNEVRATVNNIDGSTPYVTMEGKAYATKEEAEAKYVTTVYFYNSDNWTTVGVHAWGSADLTGAWGSTTATESEIGDGWYEVTLNTTETFSIIFFDTQNDGNPNEVRATANNIDGSTPYVTMEGKAYATQEAAEEEIGGSEETGTTTVYFYNSDNWTTVGVHAWGSADLTGAWGSTTATESEIGDGWYEITLNTTETFSIIFFDTQNDGNPNEVRATVNNIDGSTPYVTMEGKAYATQEAAEEEIGGSEETGTTTVYFYNSDNWTTVKAYVYGASVTDPLGAFPGTEATREGETDWWSIEVPADPSFTIIFNNGNGTQSKDVTISNKDNVYVTVSGTTAYASKEAAEEAQKTSDEEAGTTKVWFYNSDSWSAVKAYVYVSGGSASEPLGGWPGASATRDNNSDWWYIEVPLSPEFTVIFNDGGSNKTSDVNIKDNTNIYVAMNGTTYATKSQVEEAMNSTGDNTETGTTTVWFYNSAKWTTVKAYVYGASATDPLGTFPGTEATREGETDWWSIEVPADPSFTIIFNDGNSTGIQSKDVTISNKENVYVTVSGTTAYASKEAAEEAQKTSDEEAGTTKVWFYNSDSWSTIKAYVYVSGGSASEPLGGWPGATATRDGSTDWWYVEVPLSPEFTVIFNDGGSNKTADINIKDNTNVYVAMNGTTYATKSEAEEAMKNAGGNTETGTTRVWFYNSGDWSNVNAYVYGVTTAKQINVNYGLVAAKTNNSVMNWINTNLLQRSATDILGGWPGTAAVRDGNTNWWYIDVPTEATFTIIFNDGKEAQSKDVTISNKETVYVTMGGSTSYATREEAEEAQEAIEEAAGKTKVWFYNSKGWITVKAYVYGASKTNPLGEWPGKAATRDGNTDWWYIEVPSAPTFTVIFNDGNSAQSKDVTISESEKIYVTVSGTTAYATKGEAEKAQKIFDKEEGTTRVWFYNSDSWATVKAYVYGAATPDPLGAWAGTTATRDGNTSWCYIDVPSAPGFTIIFNNGASVQSKDIAISDKENVYVTVSGTKAYASKGDAEKQQEILDVERKGTKRIWFYNSEGWAQIYAYVYGSANDNPLGEWPGTKCTREGDSRWWYIDITVDCPYYVIFNNGRSSQSPDIQILDSKHVYVTMNEGVAYTSKEEAEASIKTLKPILSSTTTVWFYNNVDWANVYAYVWGTETTDPLGKWPGTTAKQYKDTDWWYIKCDFSAPFYIIFNNGDNAQTQGVYIDDNTYIYTTYKAGAKYASMEAAEAAANVTTRVYFYNTEGWSEVYAYTWADAIKEPTGVWPGLKCTRESDDSYWYYVDCPCDVPFNIIFNNGIDEQTNGVLLDDAENVYVTINDEAFASKEEAEATIENVKEILPVRAKSAVTVWFYNAENWSDVYLYVKNTEGENFFGSMPGIKMHRKGSTNWYYMNVATGLEFTVVFSDGADAKTAEYTVSDKTKVYFTKDGQYSSKNEVEIQLGLATASAGNLISSEMIAVVVGGSIMSVVIIGGYAFMMKKKVRKRQTA